MQFLAAYSAGLVLLAIGLFRLLAGRGGATGGLILVAGLVLAAAGGAAMVIAPRDGQTLSLGFGDDGGSKSQERLDDGAPQDEPGSNAAAPAAPAAAEAEAPTRPPRIIEAPTTTIRPADGAVTEDVPAPAASPDFVDPLTQDAQAAAEPTPPLPTPPPDDDRAVALASLAPAASKKQKAFMEALAKGREAYQAAADDVAREAARADRSAALCGTASSPDVENWAATVEAIDTDPSGRIAFAVALPDGTILRTWNNPMSDLDDQTLVLAGTELAGIIGGLKTGDAVRVSGSLFPEPPDCWRSSRLSVDQAIREPSFIFRFTRVARLQN
ncbi:hypothetical protein [Prosthecomicrobium pneumaticum]|uniref:Uncharacterized protein n=1 Tax=Prosthecomicrobium pneumaticum TaxID=81895 RepID=A0A7W9FP65_9HYPH|nr:hypothetical protein [Prosthecomicrobium pneumaticum]MBB5754218.1 hypothetical protein [Prosthecomicrobium pneumaticum]